MKEQIIKMIGRLFTDSDRDSHEIEADLIDIKDEIQELLDTL